MRTIGLLGGMSFEGSATYYRLINEGVRDRLGGLNSADSVMRSVNFDTIVAMQKSGRWSDAGDYLANAALGLERAGADCVMICAVTMHLVADAVEAAVSVPFIHIIDETAHQLLAKGKRKPLLIATRYTMENGFYQDRMARHGIDVIVPDDAGRIATHDIIFNELCQGKILDVSRSALIDLVKTAKEHGADSVIFGCTEIGLILDVDALPLPGFDSTVIHAEAAIAFALR
ncbi:aspartate/glutamate racemase family protein [Novosphingobium umbonatum]|uniref:Aspartate/glutamate racemase family protein n=1 Tax=Novosphingobium umbonatum TaxID=1908524 RepID=A0A3S2YBV3_9SPHN|nr:aspartate/glutamate racemase family protein [Novosphingobium umbonatum]RVU07022.1 aspartate/glutamate racemase family protein [Novosphingobium umbonatum]